MKRLLPFILPFATFALPQGGAGDAEITRQGKKLHITTQAPRTAIEWQDFSIAADEAVRFMQPGADSAVLNNVTSGSISHLMGTLESNGHVYIVNPNGILIGKDALINVHSLIASTLKITNADFLAGKDHFAGSEQSKVINLGTLRASGGDIHVISYQIDNQGTIEAPEGAVTLTAANEAWLQAKNKRVLIKTTLNETSETDGITNSGTIKALQTELDADGNLYKFAINHSGAIDATALKTENGRVYLRAENGCAKVTGAITAPGGHVEVLAERIGIDDEALIDVSHEKQGGAILLGGDWQGENTPFRADHTYLGPRAVLYADGQGHGSGGKIVLWGDLSSRIFGGVSACGGALGGDGGKIEISKVPLLATTRIYTDAPKGKTGTLLLDPVDVMISSGSQTPDVTQTEGTYAYSGAASSITIPTDDGAWGSGINSLLGSNNVTISAGMADTGGTGNITVNSAISWSSGNKLTLEAAGSGTIAVNANIIASHSDAVLAVAGPVQVTNSGVGNVQITVPEIHSTNASPLTLSNTGSGRAYINSPTSSLVLGTSDNPVGPVTVEETGGGSCYISESSESDLTIYSSGGLSVSADDNNGVAYVAATSSSATGSITVRGAVSVSNAGTSSNVYIWTPQLVSTDDSTVTVSNTGSGSAYIISSTSSLVLGTSDNPVGTVTVEETGGGFAYISEGDLTIYSSGGLSVSADDNNGVAYVRAKSSSATGSITVGGAVSVSNAGTSSNVYIWTPQLVSTDDSTVTVSNTGSGSAYITSFTSSLVLGTSDNPVGTVTVEETGGGSAYISESDLTIYSSGGLSVSADDNGGQAYVQATRSSATGSITVGDAVSVSNAGASELAYIRTPQLVSIDDSAVTVSNTGSGSAYIDSPTSSLVLGTSDNPVGTVTVQSTDGTGSASIRTSTGNLTVASSSLSVLQQSDTESRAYLFSNGDLEVYTTGDMLIESSAGGGSAHGYIRSSSNDVRLTSGGSITLRNLGTGDDAYVKADAGAVEITTHDDLTLSAATTDTDANVYIDGDTDVTLNIGGGACFDECHT